MAATNEELLEVAAELDTIATWQSGGRGRKVSALADRVRSLAGVEPDLTVTAPPPLNLTADNNAGTPTGPPGF